MNSNISIGCDIEEISRFENKTPENDIDFFNRIFTKSELEYCFQSSNPHQHLCARFCGKEAVVKALSDFQISDVYYSDIEILNNDNKAPYVKLEKYPSLKIKISLSHCKKYATASVLIIKK